MSRLLGSKKDRDKLTASTTEQDFGTTAPPPA